MKTKVEAQREAEQAGRTEVVGERQGERQGKENIADPQADLYGQQSEQQTAPGILA